VSSSFSIPDESIDVVIVGAGPVGLMAAAELCLAGVRPLVLERLPHRGPLPRANGLVGQVVRLLDHRGLYQRFTGTASPPRPVPAFMFGGLPLPVADWDRNPLYVLPVPQWDLEEGLQERVTELGGRLRRGHDVTGFTQDEHGVHVQVSGPDGEHRLHARFLVGCDGGHSLVRKHAGVEFLGSSSDRLVSTSAHVVLPGSVVGGTGELVLPGLAPVAPFTFHRTPRGVFVFASFQPGVHLVTSMEWDRPSVPEEEPVTVEDVRAAASRVLGVDVPMSAPTGPGRYALRRLAGRNTRQAQRYRVGRVLLAGDAAHVHSSVGGPGLNLGLQDVANLGWKLAAELRGDAPAGLLDTYHAERYPVGRRVMMHTQAQSALLAPGGEVTALRELFGELLTMPDTVRYLAATVAGADVRYTCGGAVEHPLAGRWVPDFPLTVRGRPTRLAELARDARPLLLDLRADPDPDLADVASRWADRVDLVVGRHEGEGPAPFDAALIRPDGHTAWIAGTVDSLTDTLRAWLGQPVAQPVGAG
jgi:2-polyprenyl-6-methoxyphenol hydroxylase-like FAD-dependent oxidoreductase